MWTTLFCLTSGRAITTLMQEKLSQGFPSKVLDLIHNRIDDLTVIDIVNAADMNDAPSIEVLRNAGEKLGKAISYIINLFNPELIIIGGQLSQLGPFSASLAAATMAINNKIFRI